MANIRPETSFDTQCNLFDISSIEIPKPEKFEGLDFNDITSDCVIHRENEDIANDFIVKGKGMFDDMMETVTKHLKAQFMANRLREEDYATLYADLVKHTMSLCFDAWLKKSEIEAQTEFIRMQTAQIELAMKKVPYEIKKLAADTEHVCELTIHERIKERHTESQILLTDAQTENTQENTIHERIKEDLTRQQICLTGKQCEHESHKIELTDAQTCLTSKQCEHESNKILLTDANTCLVSKQCEHEGHKIDLTDAQECLVSKQCEHEAHKIDLTDANTCVVNKQCEHEDHKIQLTDANTCVTEKQCEHESKKILNTEAQTAQIKETTIHEKLKEKHTEAQTSNVNANTTQLIPSQKRLNECQAEKACEEVGLVEAQICKANFECQKTLPKQIEVMECQRKLYCAQADKTEKEQEETEAKKALYMRQIEGYDENFLKDILKIQADAWNVGFSVSKDTFMAADGIPIIMQTSEITKYFNDWIKPNLDRFTYGRINIQGATITPDKAPG